MMVKLRRFLFEETGATAVEYGIIAALIAAVIIVAVTSVGQKTKTGLEDFAQSIP